MRADAPPPPPPPPSSLGFQASVHGASLPEFIQMGATLGKRLIYRVLSEGRAGYLYFDQGQVVHARTHLQAGQEAAFEILRWKQGSIESWSGPWPRETTFCCSPQYLLLQAAYREDEAARGTAGELIPIDIHRREDDPLSSLDAVEPEDESPMDFASATRGDAYSDAVIVDHDGTIVMGKGAEQEELAGIACYAAMLADLVGEALGLEGFQGLDARIGNEDCAVRRMPGAWGIAMGQRGSSNGVPWSEP